MKFIYRGYVNLFNIYNGNEKIFNTIRHKILEKYKILQVLGKF